MRAPRRSPVRAAALGARADRVRDVEEAEAALGAIERELAAVRERERALAGRADDLRARTFPAGLLESGDLGRGARRAELARLAASRDRLAGEREAAAGRLGAAREALARAIRTAERLGGERRGR